MQEKRPKTPEDKKLKNQSTDFTEDITAMPSPIVDATITPVLGGLWTRYFVELGEEILLDEDVRNAKYRDK